MSYVVNLEVAEPVTRERVEYEFAAFFDGMGHENDSLQGISWELLK